MCKDTALSDAERPRNGDETPKTRKEKAMKGIENMKALAERGHAGQLRKDGKTPYVEHPRAVVAQLRAWGVADSATLLVAWGHDLLEDTSVTEAEIRAAAGPRYGRAVLEGIQMLTRDRKAWPDKAAWLKEVARKGDGRALAVKSADRICNTRDFVALGLADKARAYLKDAAPVFAMIPDEALAEKVAKELEKVRAEIDAAEKGPGLTELYFVLDRSGSMGGMVRATIDGFNEVLAQRRGAAKGELRVSTVLFDDTARVLHDHIPVAKVRPLTEREYTIGGCTALLDAFGGAIEHAVRHQRHARPADRAAQVAFVVITDGFENASRKYSARQVRDLVRKETDEYGWEFLYLGANVDAFAEAGALGIDASHAANFVADAVGARTNFTDLADTIGMICEDRADVRREKLRSGMWKRRIDADFATRGTKKP